MYKERLSISYNNLSTGLKNLKIFHRSEKQRAFSLYQNDKSHSWHNVFNGSYTGPVPSNESIINKVELNL